MIPDNDNAPSRLRPTTFRDKVVEHYRHSSALPDMAAFISSHYMSAMMHGQSVDLETGPLLPGGERFGREPSAREIVQGHVARTKPKASAEEKAYLVERGLEAAREEIEGRHLDIHGDRYRLPRRLY